MSPEEFQSLSKKEQEDYEVEQAVMNRRRQKAMGPFLYARQNDIDRKDDQMDMGKESSEYPGEINYIMYHFTILHHVQTIMYRNIHFHFLSWYF